MVIKFTLVFRKHANGQKKVLEKTLDGLDGSQAMKAVGLTQHEKLGEYEGLVGILTKGRTIRTEFNKGAVVMALMYLENPEHY